MVVKKIALVGLAAMAFSSVALADDAGFYIGAQIGAGWQHVDGTSVTGTVPGIVGPVTIDARERNRSGLAGRVAIGYDITKCYGAELGYARFKDTDLRLTITGAGVPGSPIPGTGSVETHMIDLLAKGVMPIQENFNLIGKAGVAYVNTRVRARDTINSGLIGSETTRRFRPELAAGVGYSFDDHTAIDLSYAYVWGTGSLRSSHYIPSLSLLTVGATYKF